MKFSTKEITTTGILLTICIVSQYFKNLSPYITGPIVNATIIIAVLAIGLSSGLILSTIAPITAFFFTGSPIISAMPIMFLVIIVGNYILTFSVYFFFRRRGTKCGLIIGLFLGSILKALFMGISTIYAVFPMFGHHLANSLPSPQAYEKVFSLAKVTFSTTQLITALLGSLLAYLIWIPLQKYAENI